MAAVGLSDVFKYGGKFLGYVVAVVLAAGVFVGGGAFFAVTGGVDPGDPSIASLATGRASVGALLVVIGGVISLSGLFGLAHKLLADAATVAASASASTPSAEADEDTGSSESADAERPAVGDEDAAPPAGGDEPAEPAQPAADRPGDEQVPSDEAAPREEREPEPAAAGSTAEPLAAEPRSAAAASTAGSASQAADDYVDESASDEDWTESKYATGTRADAATEPGAGPATGESDGLTDSGQTVEPDDGAQAEWTPPDPAEFEQSSGPDEGEPVDDDQTTDAVDQPDDEVRTWDDVRNASSGNGIEAEQASTGVDQTSHVREKPPGTDDLVGGEDVAREPAVQDEPNFADEQPTGGSGLEDSAPVAGDDSLADDGRIAEDEPAEDDDATLADEGVTSFEVEGDDDPLGDRLSGGD